ncbi:3'-phosphoesterase [Patescibacteria group bacterium]|nr:3'-phosphoesterase [Patescibacteria group bacterium]
MKLDKYAKRRNFSKTTEPLPKIKTGKKEKLIFVIHRHAATHLHYDLRLEWKGTLMSWAVPKQPANKINEKRLAVRVEDHPIDYAGFEGTIPAGEYGAGKVKIWDKGCWIPESVKKDKIVFELAGKKLKGKFALIKFKNQPKNWLFFKAKSD